MQKDQKLGIIAFSLFVVLMTQLALVVTYDVGQEPQILIMSIGTVSGLFIGFTIWTFSSNDERRKELSRQQEDRE